MGDGMSFTIAIDGPAAAGKGTLARALAEHFGMAYLDSGLLYRAVGRRMLEGEDALRAAQELRAEDLTRSDLRSPQVAQAASRVAADPAVRAALVDFQRAFARRAGGAVIDGRDIGTVICPDADLKLYVVASDDERARRRHEELRARGVDLPLEEVRRQMLERDRRDASRDASPMRPAPDAIVLDTTDLSPQKAFERAAALVRERLSGQAAHTKQGDDAASNAKKPE